MTASELSFVHRFVPAPSPHAHRTLLLLHGTGGDESDLLPLARMLDPGAAVLSPRGKVLEGDSPRFFRRLAEGVFDVDDLKFRAQELAEFVGAAAPVYGFDSKRVTAVGFSNGANIAAALLLLHPGVLHDAVLLHPMVPLVPNPLPDLSDTSAFIGAGRTDPMVPSRETARLAELLQSCGVDVTVHWEPGGHSLTAGEIGAAQTWLRSK